MQLNSSALSRRRQFLVLALLMTLGRRAHSQEARLPELLVVNQGDGSLSFVNPATNKQVELLMEGVPLTFGHEVATSPDGRFAYLPLYSNAGVGKPGTDGSQMLVVDIHSRRIVNRIDFGHGVRPHCVVYDKASDLLYITTEIDRTVTIVNPHTLKIVGAIPTHQDQSHMLAVSHDGKRGYTANVGSGTVSVLDLTARKFITTIDISAVTQRISISNDDTMVFTADQTQPRLAVIDTATNKVKSWIPLPSVGYGNVSTGDGKWLLVTLPAAGELAVVDLKTMTVARTLKIGPGPQEVIVRPDGKMAYVSCLGGSQVAAVDLAQWKVSTMIEVGPKADGMAWVGNQPSH